MSDEQLLTKSELATRWDCSERSIERFVLKDGLPHHGARLTLRFDAVAADAWRAQRRSRRPGRPLVATKHHGMTSTLDRDDIEVVSNARISIDEAARRKLAAEAQRTELRLARERDHVVAIADARGKWESLITEARTRLLGLDSKLVARFVGCDDQAKLRAGIRAEIREVLNLLGAE